MWDVATDSLNHSLKGNIMWSYFVFTNGPRYLWYKCTDWLSHAILVRSHNKRGCCITSCMDQLQTWLWDSSRKNTHWAGIVDMRVVMILVNQRLTKTARDTRNKCCTNALQWKWTRPMVTVPTQIINKQGKSSFPELLFDAGDPIMYSAKLAYLTDVCSLYVASFYITSLHKWRT